MSILQQRLTRLFACAAALFAMYGLALKASATVRATKLDPPRLIGAWDLEDEEDVARGIGLVAVDFNLDGQVDARITYGPGGAGFFFDYPSRIIIRREFYPWTTNIYGAIGALPLGTVIGSNLLTTLDTNTYIWRAGTTNRFSDPSLPYLGDHTGGGLFAVLDGGIVGQPLIVTGDFAAREAVIAVEFLIGTNRHYGYIHCDFRKETGYGYGGTGGYVLGWAYETEPDKPIVAAPLALSPARFKCSIQPRGSGLFDIIWNATPGATFRLQSTPDLGRSFTDYTPDFVIPSGSSAAQVLEVLTIDPPTNAPASFWRVVRVK